MLLQFPKGFVWGSATAAPQIEGAHGRGDSVWDVYCREHPDRIFEAATPAIACDHVHRFVEDIRWMQRLGHSGYRMSLAWPRIDPHGDGQFSERGMDFYDRLFDILLDHGIAPNVTLYHWDLPVALGSWENPDTVTRYLAYATRCFERYGDRVRLWSTLNEPAWTTLNGYITALHPPARHDPPAALRVAHHFLQAHSQAVEIFHSLGLGGEIGIALSLSAIRPATPSDADINAAHLADGILNRWFLDPVLKGSYPSDIWTWYERCGLLPTNDPSFGSDRVDWVGVNYYYPHYASADARETKFHLNNSGDTADACLFSIKDHFRFVQNPTGRYTAWNWEIDPNGLYDLLMRAQQSRPGIPIYVTENGIGLQDEVVDGEVHDQPRIEFVGEHLQALHRAVADGANVRGYYMWSLMDNFSWINGYKKRYGFLHIDRTTLERTPKDSAFWFRDVATANELKVQDVIPDSV